MANPGDHVSTTVGRKRMCLVVSKKATFALTAMLASLGIIFLSLYTSGDKLSANFALNALSSLADYSPVNLFAYVWTTDGDNSTNMDTIREQGSQGKITSKVNPIITTMTFNKSLEIRCMESSPLVECTPPVVSVKTDKVFTISVLLSPVWYPPKNIHFSSCRYNQCKLVEMAEKPDLVIVHGVHLKDNFKPPQRWSHQLYAFTVWESPVHTHADLLRNEKSVWNNQFNLTQGYRVDSDMFSPYARLRYNPKDLDKRPNYYEIAKNKTRTAVWMVSNCRTPSNRRKYVLEMQKHIDVDILGNCGTPCSKKGVDCTHYASTYKFYLAFENSLCKDYITEKFFKLFAPGQHIFPVVRGGADYDKYFPSFTFINAAHFKTPKDLALHLKDLASDLVKYSHYLEYKDLYTQLSDIDLPCSSCKYLHTRNVSVSKTYNLNNWVVDKQCHSPTDI